VRRRDHYQTTRGTYYSARINPNLIAKYLQVLSEDIIIFLIQFGSHI
jgi:hypothetical protein